MTSTARRPATRHVADFGTKLDTALTALSQGDPGARIFLVSYSGSFSSYEKYVKGLPLSARLKHAGRVPPFGGSVGYR